jgi:hypothetical protein
MNPMETGGAIGKGKISSVTGSVLGEKLMKSVVFIEREPEAHLDSPKYLAVKV